MSGYYGEEDEHSEDCNWIYGNCDCIMSDPDVSESDRLLQLMEKYDGKRRLYRSLRRNYCKRNH